MRRYLLIIMLSVGYSQNSFRIQRHLNYKSYQDAEYHCNCNLMRKYSLAALTNQGRIFILYDWIKTQRCVTGKKIVLLRLISGQKDSVFLSNNAFVGANKCNDIMRKPQYW